MADVVPAIGVDGSLLQDDEGFALGYEQNIVRRDELVCDLVAPENFRFDPMCDWRDPARSSPYLLYMMPVYAINALENMEKIDPKTANRRGPLPRDPDEAIASLDERGARLSALYDFEAEHFLVC